LGNYWNEKLKNYVGHPASTFAKVYVRDFNVEPGKAYYIDVNKNLSFSLFGKLWWPVVARIEAVNESANDIILPLNTTIKNLRHLCNLEFMDQNQWVKYWDANLQRYNYYYLVPCRDASEGMPVEAGKPYTIFANQSWKGEIH